MNPSKTKMPSKMKAEKGTPINVAGRVHPTNNGSTTRPLFAITYTLKAERIQEMIC